MFDVHHIQNVKHAWEKWKMNTKLYSETKHKKKHLGDYDGGTILTHSMLRFSIEKHSFVLCGMFTKYVRCFEVLYISAITIHN
jgi:hypothetical protein